ncbi:MAG: hypothetical protein AM324_003170 [Candidatus Thorarchaeota archaeon SMTZ1-83]|nr:MAG: hypothetical protein AM324_04190 [Candidatus Thorarchaeota archaeon SMTZ1-83]
MTGVVDVLMDSFIEEARQARVVIDKARMVNSDFVPREGLRTLIDLVNHLVLIPLMDLALFSGELDSEVALQKKETELQSVDIDAALALFDEGIQSAEKRFRKMSDAELFEKSLLPFYESGETKNWAHYIPEMTRHIAMHKMQLWMYLKLSGLDVDMMTYYGVVTE